MDSIDVSVLAGNPVKVLHVVIGLDVGGAELMLTRLVLSHSDQNGIDHVVVSLTSKGVLAERLEANNVKVIALGISSFMNLPKGILKLWRTLRLLKPDLVQTWLYHADFLGGLVARVAGVKKVIWSVRSTDITKGGSKATLLVRWMCARLSKVIPTTILFAANTSREAHEELGYDDARARVIPNGFDVASLKKKALSDVSVRCEFGIDDSYRTIISVGRFHPVKDHKTFIQAAAMLADKYDDLRFVLLGRDVDSTNPDLVSLLQNTGKQDLFYLCGQRSNVPSALFGCDIFCLHSVTEGFPNVLGEAMALGLPCVTTDVGDAAYLLDQPSLVASAGDAKSLFKRLDILLAMTSEERQAIGDAAASRVVENFSMDKISSTYFWLYKSLDPPKLTV